MKHRCSLLVRTYECDNYGHVNNANYLHYLEFARHEYLKDIGFDFRGSIEAGFGVYVARIEIDYKKSARFDDELVITTWPIKRGAVSGVMRQTIERGAELISTAKVTWAFVNSSGVPTRIPAEWDRPGLDPDPEDVAS